MGKILSKIALLALVMAGGLAIPGIAQAQTEKWVDIHNRTGTTISTVNFSETDNFQESGDTLGSDYINPGNTYRVRIRSYACMIDVRVHYVNGANQYLRFNICTAQHVDATQEGLVVAY